MDDDGNRVIDFKEFKKAVASCGIDFDRKECEELFYQFDRDGGGTLDFDEFLSKLRVSGMRIYQYPPRGIGTFSHP